MPTTRFELAHDEWTDLGPAPCFVQLITTRPVLFVVDAEMPDDINADAHNLSRESEPSANVGLTGQHVYARATDMPFPEAAIVAVSR